MYYIYTIDILWMNRKMISNIKQLWMDLTLTWTERWRQKNKKKKNRIPFYHHGWSHIEDWILIYIICICSLYIYSYLHVQKFLRYIMLIWKYVEEIYTYIQMKREHIYIGNTKTLMRIDKEGLEPDPSK